MPSKCFGTTISSQAHRHRSRKAEPLPTSQPGTQRPSLVCPTPETTKLFWIWSVAPGEMKRIQISNQEGFWPWRAPWDLDLRELSQAAHYPEPRIQTVAIIFFPAVELILQTYSPLRFQYTRHRTRTDVVKKQAVRGGGCLKTPTQSPRHRQLQGYRKQSLKITSQPPGQCCGSLSLSLSLSLRLSQGGWCEPGGCPAEARPSTGHPGSHGPSGSQSVAPGSSPELVIKGASPVTDNGSALLPRPQDGAKALCPQTFKQTGAKSCRRQRQHEGKHFTSTVAEHTMLTWGILDLVWAQYSNIVQLNPYLLRILVGQGRSLSHKISRPERDLL